MAKAVGTWALYDTLKEVGYTLPEECADVTLNLPVDGLVTLTLKIIPTPEQLTMIGQALVKMSENAVLK